MGWLVARMDYIAVPWINDYLEELRAIVRNCDRGDLPGDDLCPQCKEKQAVINRLEEILKEHGR